MTCYLIISNFSIIHLLSFIITTKSLRSIYYLIYHEYIWLRDSAREMIRYSSKSHNVRRRPREAREWMEINSGANLAVGSKCFSWSVLPNKLRLEPQMKLALHAVTSFSSSPSVSILLASEAQKNVGRVDVIKFSAELCHFRDNSARVSAKCPSVARDSSKKKWSNR